MSLRKSLTSSSLKYISLCFSFVMFSVYGTFRFILSDFPFHALHFIKKVVIANIK